MSCIIKPASLTDSGKDKADVNDRHRDKKFECLTFTQLVTWHARWNIHFLNLNLSNPAAAQGYTIR